MCIRFFVYTHIEIYVYKYICIYRCIYVYTYLPEVHDRICSSVSNSAIYSYLRGGDTVTMKSDNGLNMMAVYFLVYTTWFVETFPVH